MDAVRTTNYWSAGRTWDTTATSFDINFFDDNKTSYNAEEWNDLANPRGVLPDDRWGVITGLFVNPAIVHNDDPTVVTGAQKDLAANLFATVLERTTVELFVGGVQICRGNASDYASPGPWNVGASTTGNFNAVTNSGYLLQFTPHEIHPRASIRVRLTSKVALKPTTSSGTAYSLLKAEAKPIWIAKIQTVDQKTVFSGR